MKAYTTVPRFEEIKGYFKFNSYRPAGNPFDQEKEDGMQVCPNCGSIRHSHFREACANCGLYGDESRPFLD